MGHQLTTHAHKGAAGKGSGVCAPHRFTGRQAPPKKKGSEGTVQRLRACKPYLEGQSLREAIIKLKNSSYTQRNRQQNNEINEHSDNKAPYLLMTVNELLELALQDKYRQDMLQEYRHGYENENEYEYEEEQDEWEL